MPLARVTPLEDPLVELEVDDDDDDEEFADDDPELLVELEDEELEEVEDDVLELPVVPELEEEKLEEELPALLEAEDVEMPTALVVAPLELAVVELEPVAPEAPLHAARSTNESRMRERVGMSPSTRLWLVLLQMLALRRSVGRELSARPARTSRTCRPPRWYCSNPRSSYTHRRCPSTPPG